MWFSYHVSGWINTQVFKAASLEEAVENAFPESYGFTPIRAKEAKAIQASWSNSL